MAARLRPPPYRVWAARESGGWTQHFSTYLDLLGLPGLPTALHTSGGTGRCGPGPAAPPCSASSPRCEDPRLPIQWRWTPCIIAPQRGGHCAIHQTAQRAQPAWPRIRASPVVHADETGWREDGANGYVWTANATSCGGVARRWWTKRWASRSPISTPPTIAGPPAAVPRRAHPLPQRRRTGPMDRGSPPALCRSQSLQPSRAMAKACCPTGLGAEAAGHCRPFLSDPSAVQGKLCRRIERHIKELFVFVAEPDVPADNNPAERSRRHLVISRKVSGGTRSERGTESKMTLASLFGTWRGLNPG